MARNTNNTILHKAKESKSDEFYTQYCDIESELKYYVNQFQGKTVFCNCDDPIRSNFFKYFVDNFHRLRLKGLMASCFHESSDPMFGNIDNKGYYIIYDGKPLDDFKDVYKNLSYFQGNGDFRSEESKYLLKKCDVVVTNPPFSLFREFVSLIMRFKKEFLIIGNINAITYKDIFELIQDNKIWLGHNLGRGISGFIVPEHYNLYGTETRVDENGNRIIASNNCLWLTNMDSPLRNEFIPLTKTYKNNEEFYPVFDNYDAINVNRTQDIPKDFSGVMGVPITFLHKYNPQQFKIIQFRKGNDGKDLSIDGKCPYFRILIKRTKIDDSNSVEISYDRVRKVNNKNKSMDGGNIEAVQLSLF